MTLASIRSDEQNAEVLAVIEDDVDVIQSQPISRRRGAEVWLGGKGDAPDGVWKWPDGQSFECDEDLAGG